MIRDPDAILGAGATATGGVGFLYWYQVATDVASDLILWGNVILVIGGIWLMVKRHRRETREGKETKR